MVCEDSNISRLDKLTICVPVYNEESVIASTLGCLKKDFPEADIIVVNDGSTDATGDIVNRIEGIHVIHHNRNMGYGASLKSAIRVAKTGVVAWFDGDGQHRTEDLKRVVKPVMDGTRDVVVGVRSIDSDVSLSRLLGKFALRIVAQLIARTQIPDLNCGLRAFKLDVIKRYLHLLPDGFSASSTSTILMIKRGYRVDYVNITTTKRIGQSKVRLFTDGFRTLQLLFRMLILFEAFYFFSFLSVIQFSFAFIYGLYIALRLKGGLPTLAAVVMISAVLTFLIGIVCDQITEIRKEKFEDVGNIER
jgi:glycosyltransferase involved in cell wall biosynthesis